MMMVTNDSDDDDHDKGYNNNNKPALRRAPYNQSLKDIWTITKGQLLFFNQISQLLTSNVVSCSFKADVDETSCCCHKKN